MRALSIPPALCVCFGTQQCALLVLVLGRSFNEQKHATLKFGRDLFNLFDRLVAFVPTLVETHDAVDLVLDSLFVADT